MSSSSSLLLLATAFAAIIGITTAATAAAPAAAGSNLTDILTKGGQYNTFIRLLRSTQVGEQIQSQLNNSFNGLTIFAPTDNAFSNLEAGTLNGLSSQEQVNLVLSHVLPRYFSLSTFQTASNPLSTQASGPGGVYTVNVSSTTNQVNVTTGIVDTQVNNPLHADFPLAVYSVDKVLLPTALFGPKPPIAAPSPEPTKSPAKDKPKKGGAAANAVAEAPSDAVNQPSAAARLMVGAAAAVGFVIIL